MEQASAPAQRFSDRQLEQIVDEATVYMCACPAQVAAAIRDLRGLYRYQQDCLEAPSSERPVHQLIAASTNPAHAELEECLDRTYPRLHMIGGGIQSQLLCQMTADACGKEVLAGPVEATVLGNIALQLLSVGAIESLREARRIIRDSESIQAYQPQEAERWQEEYQRWEAVTSC